MTPKEYWELLDKHDWFYMMSDDRSVYEKGASFLNKLTKIANTDPVLKSLLDGFTAHYFSGKPWDTVKKPKPIKPL